MFRALVQYVHNILFLCVQQHLTQRSARSVCSVVCVFLIIKRQEKCLWGDDNIYPAFHLNWTRNLLVSEWLKLAGCQCSDYTVRKERRRGKKNVTWYFLPVNSSLLSLFSNLSLLFSLLPVILNLQRLRTTFSSECSGSSNSPMLRLLVKAAETHWQLKYLPSLITSL